MCPGNDRVIINENAYVTSDIMLGDGEVLEDQTIVVNTNTLDVQNGAILTGIIKLGQNTINNININGGAFSNIDSGDETTTNNIVVEGNLGIMDEDGQTRNLTLGDSQDNVTFLTGAHVRSISLGGNDDTLLVGEGAIVEGGVSLGDGDDQMTLATDITGDIDLGDGNDLLVLRAEYGGNLIANLGENVIVADASLNLNGDFLNLGSTNNVLVVSNGSMVELEGVSLGRFLAVSENEGIYLSQNAVVATNGADFIQNYIGQYSSGGDLYVLAAPENVPSQISDYYDAYTDGVESSELAVNGDLDVEEGASVFDSSMYVTGDAVIDGAVSESSLVADDAEINGEVIDSEVNLIGDLEVNKVRRVSCFYSLVFVCGK